MVDWTRGRIVIIGAGHAGTECAVALRQRKFGGTIDLVSADPDVPYQRPPLSKDFMKNPDAPLLLRPLKFFEDNAITLLLGRSAVRVDRQAGAVELDDGHRLEYDHLVLATGARNRTLPLPGLNDERVVQLRTLADARRIAGALSTWKRVVIVGGGFVGLEAAALMSGAGTEVHVVELASRLMQRVVSPVVSEWFLRWHVERGVAFHLETYCDRVVHDASGVQVTLSNGEVLQADALLLAAGIEPNDQLAVECGLAIGNGIVADEFMITSDPKISAIGDCVSYPSAHFPGRVRLESVQNAGDQARAVASRLSGQGARYDAFPWFWSFQGDARLQIAGLARPGLSEVVRGDPNSNSFSVCLLDGSKLVAVESVNAAADHMAAKKLVGQDLGDRVADIIHEPSLKSLIAAQP